MVLVPNVQNFQYVMLCRRMSSLQYFKGVLPISSTSSSQRRILLGVLVHEGRLIL
jgi:hypothetical protein